MNNLRHFLDSKDFTKEEYEELFSLVDRILAYPKNYSEIAKGKILAVLFYEPSTRTRLSFESAMLRLGGKVIGFSEAASSSASKGETIEDTARILSIYSDIMAIRHPEAYAPHKASKAARIPVINAGDGGHEHPTQTLADLITIREKFGRLDNLKIGFCGDLKYGRTVHSLAKALSKYENNSFVFISPEELQVPDYVREAIEEECVDYIETESLEEQIRGVDILYMTRIQRERFGDLKAYQRFEDCYILNNDKLKNSKDEMIIMHPLPRINEITCEVDKNEKAWYFKQAEYGMYGRMALIIKLLQLDEDESIKAKYYKLMGV